MKFFSINQAKLKLFWLWLIGYFWYGEELSPPVKCRKIKKNEKSLVGKSYYFYGLKSWKIKSPLKGTISKIYPNYALQITNKYGFQVLLNIQVNEKDFMPTNKIFQCEVREGQEINPKTTLFIVYYEEQIIAVSVFIPWQPNILRKVGPLKKGDKECFVEVYYRNPYSELRFKKHGKY